MNTETLFEKAYSEIHFAKVKFQCVVGNTDDNVGDTVAGRIVGIHRGKKVKRDSNHELYVGIEAPTVTIRYDDTHKDVRCTEWDLIEFEPCDDVEQVKQEWQA